MRFRVRKSAHVLERFGLAMAGAAERLVCRRSRGVERRGTDVPGFFTPNDDWWRRRILPWYRHPSTAFSLNKRSAIKGGREDRHRGIPERAGHVSRGVLVFCCGGHDCTPPRSAHRLDDNDHGGMGGWRGHANHCWSDDTPSPLRRRQSTAPPLAAIYLVRARARFSGDNLATFDCVIANPPFSLEKWGEEVWVGDPHGRNFAFAPSRTEKQQSCLKEKAAQKWRCFFFRMCPSSMAGEFV